MLFWLVFFIPLLYTVCTGSRQGRVHIKGGIFVISPAALKLLTYTCEEG